MIWRTIGFEKIKRFFESVIQKKILSHAYLFSGQDMIGKKTFAIELGGVINGTAFGDGINPDLLFIGPASSESGKSITIEEIRKAKDFASFRPNAGPYKFIIIDDANLMTVEAQNALLKILEEPNPSSILILVTANPASLLPTICSRCQEIKFTPHPKKTAEVLLKKINWPRPRSEFLLEFSNGRIGLVKNVIDGQSFDEIKESVEELSGLIQTNINERFMAAQKLSDEKNEAILPKKILYWMLYSRMRLAEPRAYKILKNLLHLQRIVNQPQFNHRLALENFLVQL